MKKLFFFASLLMLTTALFCGCNQDSSPLNDTTHLWPAPDVKGVKWGYINDRGNMVVGTMYDNTELFSCGYGIAKLGSSVFVVKSNGKIMTNIPDLSDGCGSYFYNNCLRYRVNGNWGLLNHNFKIQIQPVYYSLGVMSSSGLVNFISTRGEKYGYLNKDGKVAISPIYDEAGTFTDGVAVVGIEGHYGAIDTKGQFAVPTSYSYLESAGNERLIFCKEVIENGSGDISAKYGLLDTQGKEIVGAIYDVIIASADNGLFPVKDGDKWGYINKSGAVVLDMLFHRATPFYEGHAYVLRTKGGNVEVIDTKGNTILILEKGEAPASYFHNGLALIVGNGISKYIDIKGKIIYTWNGGSISAPARLAPMEGEEILLDIPKLLAPTQFGYLYCGF